MSNGTYGTIKPSLINPQMDVEIWYHYRPTRNSEDESFKNFKKIDNVSEMFSNSTCDTTLKDTTLPGMYNLKLPLTYFNKKGIYTVYIKPKEIECTIKDIGALSAYPDVRGVVLDMNDVDTENSSLFENGQLVGYRIDYIDNGLRQNYYRIITSNNKCEPIAQNLASSNTNSNGYRFNDSSTLTFLTVTPSTSPTYKANAQPFIGRVGQTIFITNTKFNPVSVEIELVEHDIETLTNVVEGNQVRSLDRGLVTTYNQDGEIYIQQEFFTLKDSYTKSDVYEVRKKKTDNIDFTQDYESIMNN